METQEQTLTLNDTVQHHLEMISSALGDEIILLNIETVVYHGLDDVAAEIWNMIEQPTRVSHIIDRLLEMFDVDRGTCETETLELLNKMLKREAIMLVSAETTP
ncbi:MAG: PqqD family protein [Candidatus Promineifilaceae bacterium]